MRATIMTGLLLGLGIAGLGMRVNHLNDALNTAKQERDAVQAAYQALAEQHQASDEAYQALIATQSQIDARHRPIIRRIQQAPTGDDAPLSPVLQQTLQELTPCPACCFVFCWRAVRMNASSIDLSRSPPDCCSR